MKEQFEEQIKQLESRLVEVSEQQQNEKIDKIDIRLEIAQDMQNQFDSTINLDDDISKIIKDLPEKDQIE